jgi:hypothetical protein
MSIVDAILTGLFCMVVVFALLVALWGIVRVFSLLISAIEKGQKTKNV